MRRHVPALSLLGTMMLLPACGSTPPPAKKPETSVAGPRLEAKVEVVQLQHVGAEETAEIVNELIDDAGGTDTRVIADTRLNAIVVYGDEVQRTHIRDLLVELDKPRR
jgi:type II secretory pathway component GspD/PulD (secretin)